MGYTKKTWTTGDVITADAMNNLEEGASLQSDYAQTDSTQPDYIKNKLVGKEVTYSDTLTWDGNTEGLEAYGGMYYKISNIAPSVAELQTGNVSCASPDGYVNYNTNDAEEIDGAINCGEGSVLIVLEDTQVEGITVTKGTYFLSMSSAGYASSLTIPGQNIFPTTTTKKLTAEYLEPFEVVTKGGDTLTWDVDTSGKTSVDVIGDGSVLFVKISGVVPVKDDFANGASAIMKHTDGTTSTLTLDGSAIQNGFKEDGYVSLSGFGLQIIPTDNYTVDGILIPEKGIYVTFITDFDYAISLTIPNYTGFTTTEKKLKGEYVIDTNSIILKSSGGKSFKVTVSDTGTLTATEI